MKQSTILACGVAFLCSVGQLGAGEIMTMGNAPETRGKLSLGDPDTITVGTCGSAPDKVNLADVLEADFTDSGFQLNYFTSIGSKSAALPSNWITKDIASVDIRGSASYANGELALRGLGCDLAGEDDLFLFAGQPWEGNGQWTFHIKELDPNAPVVEAGLMLRDSLDAGALMQCFGQTASGTGWFQGRRKVGDHAGWQDFIGNNSPAWIRLTRVNQSLDTSVSTDGVKWETIGEQDINLAGKGWVGIFLNSRQEKVVGKAVVDQITFEPGAPVSQSIPPGTLLRDGTYLAGYFEFLNATQGRFNRNGKDIDMAPDNVASVIFHPTLWQQISDPATGTGLMMKNGDFLESDVSNIQGTYVQVISSALGPAEYSSDSIRACLLRPMKALASDFEVRLTDGSILRAKGFDASARQIVIHTAVGIDVAVSQEEIAQIRAGRSRIQPLIDLPWKTFTSSRDAGNAIPKGQAVVVNAITSASPDENANVITWAGSNQEQIIAAPMAISISFPLKGKFGTVALRVAVGPGIATGTKVKLHVLADGHEVLGNLVFTAGDQPLFTKISLGQSQVLTLMADSSDTAAKILLIDPVALK